MKAREVAAWLGRFAVTLGGLVILRRLGHGALAAPPLTSIRGISRWFDGRGMLVAVFAAGRTLAFWAGCYLSVLWMLSLATAGAGPGRWDGARRALARCHLPGFRWAASVTWGAWVMGTSLATPAAPAAAASFTPAPPATAASSTPAAPVLRYLGPAPPVHPRVPREAAPATAEGKSPAAQAARAPAAPIRRAGPPAAPARHAGLPTSRVERAGPPATPARPTAEGSGGAAFGRDGGPPGREAAGQRWVVRPGDSFWSIAAAHLGEGSGRPPSAGQLGSYWWQLVEANALDLPVRGDPNLLFPGDFVILPPLPAAVRLEGWRTGR